MTPEARHKRHLRHEMKAQRVQLAPTLPNAGEDACQLFLHAFPLPTEIALYSPLGEELDTLPLYDHLMALGKHLSLPLIFEEDLLFRRWNVETRLHPGPFQALEPQEPAPIVSPDLILLPLLAFDRAGNRLGYGGGYYDRTLRHLRRIKPLLAVGYGFSFQEHENIPHQTCDEPLDYVITEKEIIKC